MHHQAVKLRGQRRAEVALWAAVCAAGAAALLIVSLILQYAVSIPMLDDWELVPVIAKVHGSSGLTFGDLFAQQQEARTVVLKLVFIAVSFARHWDSRIVMMLSVLICCLTAAGWCCLLCRSRLAPQRKAIAFLLAALLIFSPAQHELWLLASGFSSFIPAVCIVWGAWVATTQWTAAKRFWICLGLAFVATFSVANGLLAWVFTFPLALVVDRNLPWKRWLGFWLVPMAACAAIYFWHFRAQPDLPPFAPAKSLWDYWCYVTAFLGGALGRSGTEYPLEVSVGAGSVALLGYVAVVVRLAFRYRDNDYCRRRMPWLALGGYSVASAILAALGRIDWGVAQALESRYVAFSLYLLTAMVALSAIFAQEFSNRIYSRQRRLVIFAATTLFIASFVTLHAMCAIASLPFYPLRFAVARLGNSGMLFSQVLDTSKAIQAGNHPRPLMVRENGEVLDRLQLLRTPLARTREISKLRHAESAEGIGDGWLDGLTSSGEAKLTAWGWAAIPNRHRAADAVVLAYANENGEWIAFAHSDSVFDRADVVSALGSSDFFWSGWRATFDLAALPKGAEISAWAVDAKDGKLYRLKTKERLFNLAMASR